MIDKFSEFELMLRSHFNEPMIVHNEVVRCIGYAEDEDDCYIIYRNSKGEKRYCTAVGGYTFLHKLKGQEYVRSSSGEDWDDLTRLSSLLIYSNAPEEKEFLVEKF